MNLKSIAIKSTIGLSGIGGISFGSYQIYQKIKKKNSLANKLEENKYKPLADNSNSWGAILESYKIVIDKRAELKFGDFDGNDPVNNSKKAVDILKDHCKEALSNKENKLFEKVKKWFVEPITISSFLEKKGFKALNTDANTSPEEKAKWEIKIKAHKKALDTVQKITGLVLDGSNEEATDKNYTDIKEKCKQISEIKNYDEKYEEGLKVFELWCSDK